MNVYRMTVSRWAWRHGDDKHAILVLVGQVVLFLYFSFPHGYFLLPNGSIAAIVQPFSESYGCLAEVKE